MTARRGRRRKQLLDDLKEKRGYWKLKDEALDRTLWRTGFGRGYGPVVRHSGVPRGVVWGVQTPPEIPKALQNRAKLNPIVKTVKNC